MWCSQIWKHCEVIDKTELSKFISNTVHGWSRCNCRKENADSSIFRAISCNLGHKIEFYPNSTNHHTGYNKFKLDWPMSSEISQCIIKQRNFGWAHRNLLVCPIWPSEMIWPSSSGGTQLSETLSLYNVNFKGFLHISVHITYTCTSIRTVYRVSWFQIQRLKFRRINVFYYLTDTVKFQLILSSHHLFTVFNIPASRFNHNLKSSLYFSNTAFCRTAMGNK